MPPASSAAVGAGYDFLSVTISTVLFYPTTAGAQTSPDLTGHWTLNPALSQLPQKRYRMGMAVRFSCLSGLHRAAMGTTDTVSPPRVGCPEGRRPGGAAGWHHQASRSTHVPACVRDTLARGRLRHSNGCRSCSVTLTSARRWCTRTCSIADRWACAAPSIASERIGLWGGRESRRRMHPSAGSLEAAKSLILGGLNCCAVVTPDRCFAATACVQRRPRRQPCSASPLWYPC